MLMTQKIRNAYETLKMAMNESHLVPKEFVENKFSENIVKQLIFDEYITPNEETYLVFVYPTAEELNYDMCRELGCATTLRAAKDFFDMPNSQEAILRTLRSPWLNLLTEEMASRLAKTIETNPNQVRVVVYAEEE